MALTCARCGTQNPDGNRFCNNCGTALAPAQQPAPAVPVAASAAAPFTAPPAAAPVQAPQYAPQYAPQAAYQSPYYTPQPGAPRPGVHRTPWVLIVSVVVVVVLVLGAVGTVLALAGSKHNTQTSTFQSLSSPSPASSPGSTPTAEPSAQPSQPPSGGSTVSTTGETVVVPSGWQVVNKDASSVTLQNSDGSGSLTVASGQQSPPENAQQLKDQIDKALSSKYPDAAECPNSSVSNGTLAGASGIFWELCYTLKSGSQAVPIGEPIFVGANSSGNVVYLVVLQTTQDNLDAFIKEALPILNGGITWNLK